MVVKGWWGSKRYTRELGLVEVQGVVGGLGGSWNLRLWRYRDGIGLKGDRVVGGS